MEKINFINDSVPALNAANLNKLQDNIENEIPIFSEIDGTLQLTKPPKSGEYDDPFLLKGETQLNYPEGFSKNNTYVINAIINSRISPFFQGSNLIVGNKIVREIGTECNIYMNSQNIKIIYYTNQIFGTEVYTIDYKILLMRFI